MDFKIFKSADFDEWTKCLESFPLAKKDIYYTPNYYLTWLEHENAEIHCAYFKEGDVQLLYPFFKKEIKNKKLDKIYFDISTAYGYGGLLSNIESVEPRIAEIFNKLFDNWCSENDIIAEFIRVNPLFENVARLRAVKYLKIRKNTYVDFSQDIKLKNTAPRNIKRAQEAGLTIEIDSEFKYLDKFIELYYLTYKRLNMDSYYLFPQEYFDNLKLYLPEHVRIFLVKLRDTIIASSVFFLYGDKATYHLGASDFSFSSYRPNDFLFKAMIEESEKEGIAILSLGGGTTNLESDGLYQFKKKYGNTILDVYIGKKIHNETIYSQLCVDWENTHPELIEKYKNYFLKYRVV
jgi:hypothetical protein